MNYTSILASLMIVLSLGLHAQGETLTADQILEKVAKASGGAAFRNIKSLQCSGKVEYIGMGMKGTCDVFSKAPGMSRTRMSVPNLLTAVEGCDGKDAWDANPLVGAPRKKQGKERTFQILHSKTDILTNAKAYFSNREVKGTALVNGKPCYRLKLTPKGNMDPFIYYIDKATFLLAREEAVLDGPQGRITIQSDIDKYKTVDGLQIPVEMTLTVTQMKIKLTFDTIEVNKPIPDELFTFPNDLNMEICQCGKTEFTIGKNPTKLKRSTLIRYLRRIEGIFPEYKIPSIALTASKGVQSKWLDATSRWMAAFSDDIRVTKQKVTAKPETNGPGEEKTERQATPEIQN